MHLSLALEVMNLSHIIHEFSFGPFFPRISQPLDNSVEIATSSQSILLMPWNFTDSIKYTGFHIFQYFISVVSTKYIDAGRRQLDTNQYSVTDMSRETEHGRGVPGKKLSGHLFAYFLLIRKAGIFFKYDLEPMSLQIEERTVTLIDFLVRLAGIVGGILVCSGYAWRGRSLARSYLSVEG